MKMNMDWMKRLVGSRMVRSVGAVAAVAALAAGAGVVGARSAGANRGPSNTPPIVAIVDLEAVINGLDEQKDKQNELQKEATALEAQLKALAEEGENQQKLLATLTGAELAAARERIRDMAFNIEFQRQLAKRKLNQHGADMLRSLYLKVDEAAELLAKKNGYDLVLVSDEKAPIPDDDEAAARRAMLLKRMLYVSANQDITAELVQTMNNAYATKK